MGKVIPMKHITLSMEQANTLFSRECIAFSGHNCIATKKASCILSTAAVNYVTRPDKAGKYFNRFSVQGAINGSIDFLTYEGFIEAVGYYNAEQLILDDMNEREPDIV